MQSDESQTTFGGKYRFHLHAGLLLDILFDRKIEAIYVFETSIGFQRITWRYNTEYRSLRIILTFIDQYITVIKVVVSFLIDLKQKPNETNWLSLCGQITFM